MFYVRLLLFSILLYNTEAWYGDDYGDWVTYTDPRTGPIITNSVSNSTSTNATDPESVTFIKSNLTTPIEPKYRLDKTETNYTNNTSTTLEYSKDNATKPVNDEEESKPYYPDWYNKQKNSDTTTTESPYDGYNETAADDIQPATKTKKPYDNNDEYGYLTIENGYLTAHFPEASNNTKINSSDVEQSKWFNQTTGYNNTTTATNNSDYGGDKLEHWETTTTRIPYWWETITTSTTRPYWGETNITSGRRLYWWETNTTTTRRPYWWETNTTSTRRPYWWETNTTSTRRPYWWETNTTSTRRPIYRRWWNLTTTTESTNRTYWPRPMYNISIPDYRPTTDYPYHIRSTSPSSFNQSIFTNVTNATSIYGAVADFLKKLTGTILPSGVKIVSNSNNTNFALANGNGNTVVYAYNYF